MPTLPNWVHPKVAQIVLRRDKADKRDSTEKEKYICKNGILHLTSI